MKKVGLLTWLSKTKSTHYETNRIPKRRGGFREINNPDKYMRLVQSRILTRTLNKTEVPLYTWAFEQGRSVPDMAQVHVGKQVIISLDIKNFFTSITQSMILEMLEKESLAYGAAAKTISELVTYRWYLPQGGITSPKVSNLIVKNTFGHDLSKLMEEARLHFTVYADDITISPSSDEVVLIPSYLFCKIDPASIAPTVGGPRRDLVAEVIGDKTYVNIDVLLACVDSLLATYNFRINKPKTKVMRQAYRQTVCGVVVNEKTNLPRKERKRLKAMVHNVCKNGVEAEATKFNPDGTTENFLDHLKGKLNWYRMLNPEKGNALYVQLMTYLGSQTSEKSQTEIAEVA